MHLILEASQSANRSGTGRYTVQLLKALAQLPDTGLSLSALWPEGATLPEGCGAVDCVTLPTAPLSRLIRTGRGVAGLTSPPPDLVHYPANFGSFMGREPFVVTVHDLSFMRHPEWFRWSRALYYRNAARRSVHRARRVIVDSEATATDVKKFLGIDAKKIDVIPLGLDASWHQAEEDSITRVRQQYALPEQYFLYAGTLEPRKNVPRILSAWDRIAGETSRDLVLAGRVGWKAEAIEKALAQVRYPERVHRPGFVDDGDLPAVMSGAATFVWPSLFEGFGLPPLEAMACGTPVISSNSSSIPEVTGDAALLVDPESVDALAEAMRALSDSPALAKELSEKGLARVRPFTWTRTARMTLETYRRVLGQST